MRRPYLPGVRYSMSGFRRFSSVCHTTDRNRWPRQFIGRLHGHRCGSTPQHAVAFAFKVTRHAVMRTFSASALCLRARRVIYFEIDLSGIALRSVALFTGRSFGFVFCVCVCAAFVVLYIQAIRLQNDAHFAIATLRTRATTRTFAKAEKLGKDMMAVAKMSMFKQRPPRNAHY